MIEENHLLHYLILFLGLVIGLFLFVFFKYNSNIQLVIAGAISLYYALWGIVHHALEGRLTRLIGLEYILIASLVFLLLFTALYV